MQQRRGRLEEKRVVVTGAGAGIGRAIAASFAREGARVFAVSRTLAKLLELERAEPRIQPIEVDVTHSEELTRTLQDLGQIDVLVNCAGWVHSGSVTACSDEDWARSFDLNVTAPFRAIRAVLPGMVERGSGSIVNVASVASSITGVPERAAYGASKAALIGLTKAVARDVVASGVRCNALCPGTTESPSLVERMAQGGDAEAGRRAFVSRQPMGRLGTVEEMASAAVFLAGDESAFMTGQLLVVDGGQTL